ncbi:uncharacterized protein LOC119736643 [Patiria miniata]|uniref:Uncharacterized protein n=1 Tax=Patiria miniata TaxID=46514 RepID=A0A914ASG1_PATMI|nr:uncharacterized protein LOC119736643 [Patiria miniata]XP_038066596.1 uncharacterized protein LOC119736643 [Patiria miniata]XP_038066603.1 uncharacterized protein LOC119736643 [Patiria miniata]
MMMLQGSSLSDSPVVDGRQKDVFLPPLNAHRRCTGTNDCASVQDSDEATARNTQFLSTRWRAKPKKGQSRLEVNQSSMSDSFVLPRINGSSSQISTEHHDRTSRTSLSLPSRTRDTCLPLSKSCPALMGNPRRQISGEESPNYEYGYDDEDDFEESDNSRDFISVSCNADLLTNGRKRDGKHGYSDASNSQDDITDGVVRKLSKLESPRSKASQHGSHHHRNPHHQHHQHSKTKEADTTLPDIFVPNGVSFRLPPNQDHPQKTTTRGNKELHKTRQREVKRQSSDERTNEQERRVPEIGLTGLAGDNSYALDPSPWQKSGAIEAADTPPAADPAGKQSHHSYHQSSKGSKKKRKEKKQRSVEQDRPHLLRDTTQADIKCMNWLAEGHQEEGADQLSSSAVLPNVT